MSAAAPAFSEILGFGIKPDYPSILFDLLLESSRHRDLPPCPDKNQFFLSDEFFHKDKRDYSKDLHLSCLILPP